MHNATTLKLVALIFMLSGMSGGFVTFSGVSLLTSAGHSPRNRKISCSRTQQDDGSGSRMKIRVQRGTPCLLMRSDKK